MFTRRVHWLTYPRVDFRCVFRKINCCRFRREQKREHTIDYPFFAKRCVRITRRFDPTGLPPVQSRLCRYGRETKRTHLHRYDCWTPPSRSISLDDRKARRETLIFVFDVFRSFYDVSIDFRLSDVFYARRHFRNAILRDRGILVENVDQTTSVRTRNVRGQCITTFDGPFRPRVIKERMKIRGSRTPRRYHIVILYCDVTTRLLHVSTTTSRTSLVRPRR